MNCEEAIMKNSGPFTKMHCQTCKVGLRSALCHLEEEGLKECDEHKTTHRYTKGQVIFYAGNRASGLYCIFSGCVKLFKSGVDGKEQTVQLLGPGELLGYRALLAAEPYSVTAEALEDAVICCVEKNSFFPLLLKNPELALDIIKKLSHELGMVEDLATSLATRSVRERMAELLLILKEAYGKPVAKGTHIELQLSREEMADMIGVTQETAIRLLSEFKKEGLIALAERDVTILNAATLVTIAKLDIEP